MAAAERLQARMIWNALSADTPMASMPEHGTVFLRVGKGNGESSQGASNVYGRSGTVPGVSETGQTLVSQDQATQPPRHSALRDRSADCPLCDDAFQHGRGLTNHVRRMHREHYSEWCLQRYFDLLSRCCSRGRGRSLPLGRPVFKRWQIKK